MVSIERKPHYSLFTAAITIDILLKEVIEKGEKTTI